MSRFVIDSNEMLSEGIFVSAHYLFVLNFPIIRKGVVKGFLLLLLLDFFMIRHETSEL